MGNEAYLWSYREGDVALFAIADVIQAFGSAVQEATSESNPLRLEYDSKIDSCDVFLCEDESDTPGYISSLMIARPCSNPSFWNSILSIMRQGHFLLFFSDDTTPLFWDLASAEHFPADLIESLGTPTQVRDASEIAGRLMT
jgi:hypothetical protein